MQGIKGMKGEVMDQLYQSQGKMKIVLGCMLALSLLGVISGTLVQGEHDAEIKIGVQKRFHIAGHITVSVLNNTVDIRKCQNNLPTREGIAYTHEEWKKFVQRIPKVEKNIGVYRIGAKSAIITTQEPMKIQLMALFNGCPSIKGLAVTLKQWFQIVNLVPQINRIINTN